MRVRDDDCELRSIIRPPLLLTHIELPVRLRPAHLDGTPLEVFEGRTYDDLKEPTFAFAAHLFGLILPIPESNISEAIEDFDATARESEALRDALQNCEPGWSGVIAATSVECWALGAKVVGGTESRWNPETLWAAARMLDSKKWPRGLGVKADDLSRLAASLGRIALETERLQSYVNPRASIGTAASGRPREIPALLFERFSDPLKRVFKAERARLTAGFLSDFDVVDVEAETILRADTTAIWRASAAARKKHQGE